MSYLYPVGSPLASSVFCPDRLDDELPLPRGSSNSSEADILLGRVELGSAASVVLAADANVVQALPIPQVIVTEKGWFETKYMRVRDWLVDKFPSLDNWLPDETRTRVEKAHFYALKVKDAVHVLSASSAQRGSDEWHELFYRVAAFTTIATNASRAAEDLYNEFSSHPPSFLHDADVARFAVLKQDWEDAKFYSAFAQDFAKAISGYCSPKTFDALLDVFSRGRATNSGDRPIDFADLPFLARVALEVDDYDSNDLTPCANALRQVLMQEKSKVGQELQSLPQEVAAQKAQMQQTLVKVRDLGDRVDGYRDQEESEADDVARFRQEWQDNSASVEREHAEIVSLTSKAHLLIDARRHLDDAEAILNPAPVARGRQPLLRQDFVDVGPESKDESPGTPSASHVSSGARLSSGSPQARTLGTLDASAYSFSPGQGLYGGGFGGRSSPFGNDSIQ